MIIHNIKITNFKSIYNTTEFNFDELTGLIKLSGNIGSGKTTLCEAILYGLYGQVKQQKIPQLVSWNAKRMEVCINLTSKNNNIYIKRCNIEPLEVYINGKLLPASSKNDTQEILERDYYDIPKMAVEKMCLISFNSFKSSLANMNPGETRQFLDNVFGFSTFTDYTAIASEYKSETSTEISTIETQISIYNKQLSDLNAKKLKQQEELKTTIDTDNINSQLSEIDAEKDKIKELSQDLVKQETELNNIYNKKKNEINKQLSEIADKRAQIVLFGKQAKNNYNTFKSGVCPTCGQEISTDIIDNYKSEIEKYKSQYIEVNNEYIEVEKQLTELKKELNNNLEVINSKKQEYKTEYTNLKQKENELKQQINIYNEKKKLLLDNYDNLISEAENKITYLNVKLSEYNKKQESWSKMTELLSKTLRYKLLDTLIPHINNSIQLFINKLNQQFSIEFDQEFKPHIYSDNYNKEINYNNLSTGQKKSLDLAIVFGILQNIITNVEFNIIILDELFSNMDADTRNMMLDMLSSSVVNDSTSTISRSVFVINHAEMADDYFTHKLQVKLNNIKIDPVYRAQGTDKLVVQSSVYNQVF